MLVAVAAVVAVQAGGAYALRKQPIVDGFARAANSHFPPLLTQANKYSEVGFRPIAATGQPIWCRAVASPNLPFVRRAAFSKGE